VLKDVSNLRSPDPYYSGEAGFIGSTMEQLHQDMSRLELCTARPFKELLCSLIPVFAHGTSQA
jgi:hypothetical protein